MAISIQDISINKLKYLDVESLSRPGLIEALISFSDDPQFDMEFGYAREAMEIFDDLRERIDSGSQKDTSNIQNALQILTLKFEWKAFPVLSQKQRLELIGGRLVWALIVNLGVRKILEKHFSVYESRFIPLKEDRREFTHALEQNQEELGENLLVEAGQGEVKPTVQAWLRAYNSSQPLSTPRGKFNQINFINTDKNVANLDSEGKRILENLLEIYDWLLFPVPEAQILPDESYQAQFGKQSSAKIQDNLPYIKKERFELPNDLVEKKPIADKINIPSQSQPRPVKKNLTGPVLPPLPKINPPGNERQSKAQEIIKKNLRKAEGEGGGQIPNIKSQISNDADRSVGQNENSFGKNEAGSKERGKAGSNLSAKADTSDRSPMVKAPTPVPARTDHAPLGIISGKNGPRSAQLSSVTGGQLKAVQPPKQAEGALAKGALPQPPAPKGRENYALDAGNRSGGLKSINPEPPLKNTPDKTVFKEPSPPAIPVPKPPKGYKKAPETLSGPTAETKKAASVLQDSAVGTNNIDLAHLDLGKVIDAKLENLRRMNEEKGKTQLTIDD